MRWRTHRARMALAALGALALHALLVGIALLPRRPAEKPPEQRRLAVELRRVPGRTAAAPAATASSTPTSTPKSTSSPTSRSTSNPTATPTPTPTLPSTSTPPSAPSRGSKDWLAAEGVARQPGGPLGVTMTLRDPLAALGPGGRAAASEGPVRVPTREEQLVEEKARVELRIRTWNDDFQARERARDARDAYWQTVQDAMAKDFKVDWEILDRASSPPVRSVRQAAESWARAAEAYGKGGSPYGDRPPGRRDLNDEAASVPAQDRGLRGTALEVPEAMVDLQLLAQSAAGGDGPFYKRLVVLVRIVQREDGSLESAEIAGSSGNRAYDETALSRARSLGGTLGPPPRTWRRTLWAFESDFSVFPPLPVAGCGLDAVFLPRDCVYPFKKTVRMRIQLQAIY